jgi:hypothetical protein
VVLASPWKPRRVVPCRFKILQRLENAGPVFECVCRLLSPTRWQAALGRVLSRAAQQRAAQECLGDGAGWLPARCSAFSNPIRWDEERLRDRCQQLVAAEHADP